MDRRQALDAYDEDDLLQQQQKFLRKEGQPAAKVTRIKKPSTAQEPAAPSASDSNNAKTAKKTPVSALNTVIQNMAVSDVLRDIQEKPITPLELQEQPKPLHMQEQGAFPPAMHRKESKFALSRRAKAARSETAGDTSQAATTANMNLAGDTLSTQAREAATSAACQTPLRQQQQQQPALPEASGIHQENMSVLQDMSADEMKEALSELQSRLKPETLQFLRARGAAKAAGTAGQTQQDKQGAGVNAAQSVGPSLGATIAQTAQSAVGSIAAGVSSISSKAAELASQAAHGVQSAVISQFYKTPDIADAPGEVRIVARTPKDFVKPSGTSHESTGVTQKATATASAATEGTTHTSASADQAGQEAELPADPRLFARIRWGLNGEVVCVQQRAEMLTATQVLMRDQLRKDEGSVPEGYTVTELLLLARSSLPAQRVAALKMLGKLLVLSHPSPVDTGMPGMQASPRVLTVSADLVTDELYKSDRVVRWIQVWQYLVSELQIASHLRLALDQPQAPVYTAACEATSALVCSSIEEAVMWESIHGCPRLGWPCLATAPLTRVSSGATWSMKAVAQQKPPANRPGRAAAGEEEEEESPEDVSASDPVAGLLQMNVLQRLRYILDPSNNCSTATATHVLKILAAIAAHSHDAALLLARTVGLLDIFKSMLLRQIDEQQPGSTEQPQSHNNTDKQAWLAVQTHVLYVLQHLTMSSSVTAQLVKSSGIMPTLQGHLLVSASALASTTIPSQSKEQQPSPSQQAAELVQHALVVVQILRIWRTYAAHGISVMNFESMHEGLAPLLPLPRLLALDQTDTVLYVLHWHVAKEIYAVLDAVQAHALAVAAGDASLGAPMLQPGTAAALATDMCLTWLHTDNLTALAKVLVDRTSEQPALRASQEDIRHWHASGTNPLLFTSTRSAIIGCWAAACNAAATYWSSISPELPVFGQITTALSDSGLLQACQQPQSGPQQDVTSGSPADQLAMHLLKQPTSNGISGLTPSNDTSLGGLITSVLLQQLTCIQSPQMGSKTCGEDAAYAAFHVQACQQVQHAATSAELVSAILRLATTLPTTRPKQNEAQSTMQGQQNTENSLVSVALQAVAKSVVTATDINQLGDSKTLSPPQIAGLSSFQPFSRLLIQLCSMAGDAQTPILPGNQIQAITDMSEPSTVDDTASTTEGSSNQSDTVVVDALLCTLVMSLPGAEQQCLAALRLITTSARLHHLIAASQEAISSLGTDNPLLYCAAGGANFRVIQAAMQQLKSGQATHISDALQDNTQLPYPPSQQPDIQAVSKTLLDGYAAAWLAMVAVQDDTEPSQTQALNNPQAVGTDGINQQGVVNSSVTEARQSTMRKRMYVYSKPQLSSVSESRLPVSPAWIVSEILQVSVPTSKRATTQTRPTSNSTSSSSANSIHPVGAALLLVCGLLQSKSEYIHTICGKARGLFFQQLLLLAYTYNAAELLQQEMATPGTEADQQAMQWMDSHVRWPLAVLTHHLALQKQDDASTTNKSNNQFNLLLAWCLPPSWCHVRAAERLVHQFGSSSFGDPLFAQHMVALLLPSNSVATQQSVWSALEQDQALHLLPPTELCLGSKQSLLVDTSRDSTLLDVYARSMTGGQLQKAMSMGSVSADLAIVTLAAFICDPCGDKLPATSSSSHKAQLARQAAVREAVVQLGGSNDIATVGSADLRQKATLRAVGIARSLVQALTPAELSDFLTKAQSHGWQHNDVASALVQACRGDLNLMDKLKVVLTREHQASSAEGQPSSYAGGI